MLKILIVEDEELIREGISAGIAEKDSEKYFCVVAQAEDGEEGLEQICAHRPDIVITDIKMPFMDGITMLEKAMLELPELYTVILSGHDEFEYARRALKAGAYDYLLKPIKIKNLMEILDNIRMELEEKSRKKDELFKLKQIEKDANELTCRSYLGDLMLGKVIYDTDSSGAMLLDKAGMSHAAAGIITLENMALSTKEYDYLGLMEMNDGFERIVGDIAAKHPELVLVKEKVGECLICVAAEDRDSIVSAEGKIRARLGDASVGKMKLNVVFGPVCDSMEALHDSYMEAVRLREQDGFDFDKFISRFEKAPGDTTNVGYMDFDDGPLLSAVRTVNKAEIEKQLDVLAQEMKKQKVLSQLHMLMVSARIYFDVSKLLSEVSYKTEEALISNMEHFNRIISQSTPDAIAGHLKEYCGDIADFIDEVHGGKFARVLSRAKEFIQNNFMSENIMLEDVAQFSYISASYLCIIFKKEAGETFIEYLTRIRMENAAKLLLETDMKNYEIAEACGYSNPTYFSTIFKKYYNTPPSVYKSKHKKNGRI